MKAVQAAAKAAQNVASEQIVDLSREVFAERFRKPVLDLARQQPSTYAMCGNDPLKLDLRAAAENLAVGAVSIPHAIAAVLNDLSGSPRDINSTEWRSSLLSVMDAAVNRYVVAERSPLPAVDMEGCTAQQRVAHDRAVRAIKPMLSDYYRRVRGVLKRSLANG